MLLSTQKLLATALALALLTAASSLRAQVTMKVETYTDLVAGKQSIAAGTLVPANGLSVKTSGGGSCQEAASASITLGRSSVTLATQSTSFCNPAPVGSGAMKVTLSAPQETAVVLLCTGDLASGSAEYRLDVGNDGSVEASDDTQFAGKRDIEVPVLVGPKGVDIVVSCRSQVGSLVSTVCSARFTLAIATGSATSHLQVLTAPCGPRLRITYFQTRPFFLQNNFHIEARELKPTFTWMVFGQKPTNKVLPMNGCALRANPDEVFTMIPTTGGRARLMLSVPATLTGAQALVQCVQAMPSSGNMDWSTSETYLLSL